MSRVLSVLAVCLIVSTSAIIAQEPGRLAGVARDTTGAVLPGVLVTVTGPSLATPRTIATNERGAYVFDNLPTGRYEVEATLSDFATDRAEVIVEGQTTYDVTLSVFGFAERMTVTATKTGANDIQSTPVAMTALNARTIEQMGIQAPAGLAGFVPGLTVSHAAGGRVLITIRGIGTNSAVTGSDPSSTLYLDGVYLARAAMAAMDLLDVERVEVLRGPQGTLYGRNSVGGAIHIVTQQPTNALETNVRFTAGSDHQLRAEGAVRGPLIKNNVMGSFAFLRGSRSGFVKDLDHPDHPLGGEDTWAGRGQLRVVFGTRSELLLSGDYGRFDGIPLPIAKPILAKPGFLFDSPARHWEVRTSDLAFAKSIQSGVSARLTARLNGTTTLTSLTVYRKSNERFFIDRDSTELSLWTTDVQDDQRQVSQELTVAQRTPKLKWIAGAMFFDERNDGSVEVTNLDRGIQNRPLSAIDAHARAAFGQATYQVSSRVSMTGGGRYSHERKGMHNIGGRYWRGTADLIDMFYDVHDSATFPAWTPRVAVQIQASRDTFLYVSATRGFKSGGFNPTTRDEDKAYMPEFAWTYESGIKQTFAGGRVRASAAVFYNDYRNLQVEYIVTTGVRDTQNAASATIGGAEIEVAAAVGRGLQLTASMSWLDATYDRYDEAVGPGGSKINAAGNRLNNAPEWSGSGSALYTFPARQAGSVFVRGDVSWQSRVFFTPFNDEAFEMQPAYGLAHLRAGFEPRSRRWEIAAYTRNLLNRAYLTATLNPDMLPAILGRPGEPRQSGVQVTIRP